MPSRVRKFVNREFIKTIDLDLFRRFLEPYAADIGFDWTTLPDDDGDARDALFELFRTAENFPTELQNALHHAKILAGSSGAAKLLDLAELHGVELLSEEEARGPASSKSDTRYLALKAYVYHPKLFTMAVDVARLWGTTHSLERLGAKPGVSSRHDDLLWKEDFRKSVSRYFLKKYCGTLCDIRWYADEDEIGILVLHGRNVRTAHVEEHGEERARPFREIAEDTIRYNARTGRIKIGAESKRDAKKLLELFAEHLIGERDFFAGAMADQLYTLDPVMEAGTGFRMQHEWDPSVTKIVLREIGFQERRWTRGATGTWKGRFSDDRNVLERLRLQGFDISARQLEVTSLKLDFHMLDGDAEVRIPVVVQPPNSARFLDHAHEGTIFEHLERNGLRRVGHSDKAPLAAE